MFERVRDLFEALFLNRTFFFCSSPYFLVFRLPAASCKVTVPAAISDIGRYNCLHRKANVNLPGSGIKLPGGLRMDTHSRTQWIVAVLLGVGAMSFPVFAGEVYTYSGDFNLQIPAEPDTSKGWMADAIIEINRHFTILDLDVGITLTHSNVFDLQIFLQSPEGTTLCLNTYDFREFFEGEDYTQTVFDDEAEVPIEEAEPPFTGRFKPKAGNLLEIFDDQDAYGPWRLQIYDAWNADTGTLESFELTITTVPEPATVALLVLGAGLAALLRPHRRR